MRYVFWILLLSILGCSLFGLSQYQRDIKSYITYLNNQTRESNKESINIKNPLSRFQILYTKQSSPQNQSPIESGNNWDFDIALTWNIELSGDQKTTLSEKDFDSFFEDNTKQTGEILETKNTINSWFWWNISWTTSLSWLSKQEIIKIKLKEFEANKKSTLSWS